MKRVGRYVVAVLVAMAVVAGGRAGNPVDKLPEALHADSVMTDTVMIDTVMIDTLLMDSVTADTTRTRNGLNFPHVSEMKDIHRNDSLTGLQKMKGYGNFFVRIIDAFDDIDSNYVERIGYNFTAMLQGTTNFEFYTVGVSDYVEHLTFAQHPDFRVGPYFGWRWLFLGYTFDVTHLGSSKKTGQRFEFSIYTSMFGLDLIKRSTGNDFFIRSIDGLGEDAKRFEGHDCNYINANLIGLNAYYNFNHRKFSSPAVFSQSTIQRRSAGSWQVGGTFTIHDVNFDYTALPTEMLAETENKDEYVSLERIKYFNYAINGGYAYNYVPARGWCIGVSVMPQLGYMYASAKTAVLYEEDLDNQKVIDNSFAQKLKDVFRKRGSLNYGGTVRLGVIYNTGRWFVGAFGLVHSFNYSRNSLRFNNTFGNANVCAGFYFQKKKKK